MANGIWVSKNRFINFNERKDWNPTKEIATRGRRLSFSTIMKTLPNPDPVLKKMGKQIEVYRDLLSEGQVGACVKSRKAGVTKLNWGLSRGKARTKQIELIEDTLKKLKMDKVIKEMLDAPMFGYQPIEVMWGDKEGLWLPVELKGKPVEWFCFGEENNDLRFKSSESYWTGEELPERKFLCPTQDASYNNPYGVPELSRVFWPVTFKKGGWQFWMFFIEKYGMPIIWGKHPPGDSQENIDALADALEKAVQDAVLVTADNNSVELKDSPFRASSTGTYKTLLDTCNAEISKSIIGQTQTTEITGGTGSLASAQVHGEVRQDIVDADVKIIEETFGELIQWICELNFPGAEIPVFEMWADEDVDLTLSERDSKLIVCGVRFTKKYFQKNYGLEDEDFEVSYPEQVQTTEEFAEQLAPLEELSEEEINAVIVPEELQKIGEKILEPVVSLVNESSSYEEVMESLSKQYPLMHTNDLEELLTQGRFMAHMRGKLADIT